MAPIYNSGVVALTVIYLFSFLQYAKKKRIVSPTCYDTDTANEQIKVNLVGF